MDPVKLVETALETSPQLALVGLIMWIHYKIMKEMLSIIKGKNKGTDDSKS